MRVEQVAEIVNESAKQQLGLDNVVEQDLSNLVTLAQTVDELNESGLDNFVHSLIDRIGVVKFRDRPYDGAAPSVYMDSFEYGSILQKIEAERPKANENESWRLEKGRVYEQDLYTPPTIIQRFFNDSTTYDIPMSFAERQVKSAFSSGDQLNGFFSMIENRIHDTVTINNDGLIELTINNMIGVTLLDEYREGSALGDLTAKSGVKAVNLLKLYNNEFQKTLTKEQARLDPNFIRYACFVMSLYEKRFLKMSTLFNIGKRERFTSKDKLHIVMLDEFKKAADVFLQSSTWHDEYTKLPAAETVPYWQGSGLSYDFADTSKIAVKVKDIGNNNTLTSVETSGILCIMFDRDALGINNYNYRVRSHVNNRAEFTNHWYKVDARYFNDENENFVVFFIA